jgi:2-polyprenyl-3-methyl-5-hydroxy-6-metoxy-1,4-benzoquinol methylase
MLADAQSGLPLKSNSIDIVVMLEVIEHLEKPTKVLKEISRVLKTNGILYITTPNWNALGRLMLGHNWYGFLDKTHQMLFTPSSLRSLIKKEGFNIIKIYVPFQAPLLKHIGIVSRIGLGGQIRLMAKKA